MTEKHVAQCDPHVEKLLECLGLSEQSVRKLTFRFACDALSTVTIERHMTVEEASGLCHEIGLMFDTYELQKVSSRSNVLPPEEPETEASE